MNVSNLYDAAGIVLVGLVVTALWRLAVLLTRLPSALDGLTEAIKDLRHDQRRLERRMTTLEARNGVSA